MSRSPTLRARSSRRALIGATQPFFTEPLERRRLLSISVTGIPTWIAQGPSPSVDGQDENVPGEVAAGNNPVTGAVQAIAVDPANANIMYVGTTNGGIWKTTTGTFSRN